MAKAPWPGAVGVSGGGDSIALMLLLAAWAKRSKRAPPIVLTVDHGLQRGSRVAVQKVLNWAKEAGLEAHGLVRKGAVPRADIEAAARDARYKLMGGWCREHGIAALYIAHTIDDQAETFLLRLARGSGVDGLSAMRTLSPYPLPGFDGLTVARPLLKFGREELRAALKAGRQDWLDDPMNTDVRFARTRIRAAWPALLQAGISPTRVADAAIHLRRAREALEWTTQTLLAAGSRSENGVVTVDGELLAAAPREIGLRALADLLMRVSQSDYRPRFDRLERLYDTLVEKRLGAGATLHGCKVAPATKKQAFFGAGTLVIARERPRRLALTAESRLGSTKG